MWIASVSIPQRWIVWPVITDVKIEQRIDEVPFEDVAGHVFGGRHVLQRCVREDLARELRLRDLIEEAVLEVGIDFVCVAQADLRGRAGRRGARTPR